MSNELKNFKSALLGALPFPVGRRRHRHRHRSNQPPPAPIANYIRPNHTPLLAAVFRLALKSSLCQVNRAVYNTSQVWPKSVDFQLFGVTKWAACKVIECLKPTSSK